MHGTGSGKRRRNWTTVGVGLPGRMGNRVRRTSPMDAKKDLCMQALNIAPLDIDQLLVSCGDNPLVDLRMPVPVINPNESSQSVA